MSSSTSGVITDSEQIDVLIVGAGPSGAVTAATLVDAGLRVMCLEQGDWPDYSRARAGHADFEVVARKDWNWDPNVRRNAGDYSIDDTDSDITALMYNGVGGSSVLYAAHWERFLPSDFRVRTLDGVGDDWPVTYEEMEPYYDQAERQFGVSGLEGDTCFPEGTAPPMPPVPLNKVGRAGARALNELGWHWWPASNAIATAEYGPLHRCAQKTSCPFGCPTGAKGSVDRTHWPELVRRGVQLVTGARVTRIEGDHGTRVVSGAHYLDREGKDHFQAARAVVLCGNGIGTPRLLLNSGGLANSSGLVGRRLMMHPFGNAIGVFEEDLESWRGPLGQYLHSLEFYETDETRGFVRGAKWNLMPSGAPMSMMLPGLWGAEGHWGPDFTKTLRTRFGRSVVWSIICEDLPDPDNRVVLSDEIEDDGMPGAKLIYRTSENSTRMLDFHLEKLRQVLETMGAKEIILNSKVRSSGWHILGTTCMGDDPATSVVDAYGRTHDLDNLYVFDGSVFPTSSGVNPTATIAANALRCAEHMVTQLHEQVVSDV